MKIEATWGKPIPLKKCPPGGLIYDLDLKALPQEPGAYVFCRKFGSSVIPIYVGETQDLRARVKGHLKSLPLMRAIENAPNGQRILLYCTVAARAPVRAKQHVKTIEHAVLLHAQSEGHELFNTSGAKLPTDEIAFVGNRTSEKVAPRLMRIKRALVKRR